METYTATIQLSAQNLPNKETFGTSDPYMVISYQGEVLYETEVVDNNVENVEWAAFTLDMPRQALLDHLTITIADKDKFTKDDPMIACQIRYPFAQSQYVIGEAGCTLTVVQSKLKVNGQLRAENLCNQETFGVSDPYFTIALKGEELYRSDKIANNIEFCDWAPFEIEVNTVDAMQEDFEVTIMDDDHCSMDDLMAKTTVQFPFSEQVIDLNDAGSTLKVLMQNGPRSRAEQVEPEYSVLTVKG